MFSKDIFNIFDIFDEIEEKDDGIDFEEKLERCEIERR